MKAAERRLAQQQNGRALGREAVLVNVGGKARDTGHGKVEVRDRIALPPREGREETAEAGIDMQPQPARLGQRSQFADRIEDAVRVAGRRGHQHDRAGVDGRGHGRRIDAKVRADRHPAHLQSQGVCGLVDARMAAAGHDDVGPAQRGTCGQRLVARRHDCQELAFRAAGGESAAGRRAGIKEGKRHGNDLALESDQAREGPAPQGVFREVEIEGPLRDLRQRRVMVIDVERQPAVTPAVVLMLGLDQRALDLLPGPPLVRQGHRARVLCHRSFLWRRRDPPAKGCRRHSLRVSKNVITKI